MGNVARIASTLATLLLLLVALAGALPCGQRCNCATVEAPATCHHEAMASLAEGCCSSGQSPAATVTVEPRLMALPATAPTQLALAAPPWVPEPALQLEPTLGLVPLYTLHASLLI